MLFVNDIYPCIQGEGCLTGTPMVLIRLQGCSVGCAWCDTKETWKPDGVNLVPTLQQAKAANPKWTLMDGAALARNVRESAQGCEWVLLTGGEPAEHAWHDLREFVVELYRHEFKVALESSGTARGHLGIAFDWVCVSPKFDNPGRRPILKEVVAAADEVKQVVGRESDIARLECLLNEVQYQGTVCLQPVSTSPKATELCMKTCIARGWRLSLQTHKFIGAR